MPQHIFPGTYRDQIENETEAKRQAPLLRMNQSCGEFF